MSTIISSLSLRDEQGVSARLKSLELSMRRLQALSRYCWSHAGGPWWQTAIVAASHLVRNTRTMGLTVSPQGETEVRGSPPSPFTLSQKITREEEWTEVEDSQEDANWIQI